jgi:hypothetical protein
MAEIKLIDPNVSFMGFYFLETVYTQFHLDEIPLLSFFINYLPYHLKILCDSSFIENKTPIDSSLRCGCKLMVMLFFICGGTKAPGFKS